MFDHVMRVSADSAHLQLEVLDRTSHNLGNMQTSGYKAKRFETYLNPDGAVGGTERTDTSEGEKLLTNRELDIAVEGFGYIPVTQPDGTTAYTRDGSLTLNSEGYLITNRGDIVGNGIQIPDDYQEIMIDRDGTVKVNRTGRQITPTTVGKIAMVRFPNDEGLENIGFNKVVPSFRSGEPVIDGESEIKQRYLERANVDPHEQIEQILRLNAAMVANLRVVKFTDDLFRQAVNLRQ